MENALTISSNNLPSIVSENTLSSYIEKVKSYPILSEEEEYMLAKRLKEHGDIDAAHKLVTSHLRLALKVAFSYKYYGLPISDLISEANIGLMHAVKKFNPDNGNRLSTYALWWIKAAINDFVIKSWSLVKIGTVATQKKLFYNLNRIKARLGILDDKEMSDDIINDISEELNVSKDEIVSMNGRLGGDSSLNEFVSDDYENEKIDFLSDDAPNQEERLGNTQEHNYKISIMKQAISQMNDREQYIIANRHLRSDPLTLEVIGEHFGISRERVRQIESRAMEKLTERVKEMIGDKQAA